MADRTHYPQITRTPWIEHSLSRVRWSGGRVGGRLEMQAETRPFAEILAPSGGALIGGLAGLRAKGAVGAAIGATTGLALGVLGGILLSRGYGETRTQSMSRKEWNAAQPKLRPESTLALGTGWGAFATGGLAGYVAMKGNPAAIIGGAVAAGAAGYFAGKALDD